MNETDEDDKREKSTRVEEKRRGRKEKKTEILRGTTRVRVERDEKPEGLPVRAENTSRTI